MTILTIFSIIILVVSVVIHEVSHGYMAYILGDPTAKLAGRLTLNPIPHIDPVGSVILPLLLSLLPGGIVFGWAKPVPYNPYNLQAGKWGPAYVAAAGPISNVILAVIFGFLIRLSPILNLNSAFVTIFSIIVLVNIMLALFNLIPIPPLDGSTILLSVLPPRFRYLEELLHRQRFLFILIAVLLAGFLIDWFLPLIYTFLTGISL
ncbi:MAG: site-2 protease family protein [Candidatus Paceibacterota bacterium]|jgi:Zn-dependent protease